MSQHYSAIHDDSPLIGVSKVCFNNNKQEVELI